jgi:cytochrome b561
MATIAEQVYPRQLRALHWMVVALVIVQLFSADWMEDFFRRAEHLPLGTLPDTAGSALHALSGATILVLMAVRFLIRLKYGTPPLPSDLPRGLQLLALTNHFAFYAVLVLMPLTGLSALMFARDLGAVHEALKNVLYVLVGLHLAGVAFHMFVLRDGLLWRMLVIRR